MLDIADEKLHAAAGPLRPAAEAFAVDVADEGRVEGAVAGAVDWLGGLDGLVNAAGYTEFEHTVDYSLERWNRIIGVVLTGTFLMNRACIPALLDSEREGVVVNVASIGGMRGKPWQVGYSSAKGGVINLTRALATEYANRIRFNCVAPGPVLNDIATNSGMTMPEGVSFEDFTAAMERRVIPPGRFGTNEDLAGVITFLLSDDSRYVEGATIVADGGALA
jgi:NAD(P)-dependent dehydrogenase (short-subunit alcohol dehydrogenase family)